MQLLANAEPKWPSIIKRQPSRGLQFRCYSRAVVVCFRVRRRCYQTVGSNEICEKASFNKANHGGRMPFEVYYSAGIRYVFRRKLGPQRSRINKQQIVLHRRCLLDGAIMSGYVNLAIVSSAPGARTVFRRSQHDFGS